MDFSLQRRRPRRRPPSLRWPAHDITVSKDGRIFMLMVNAPALVEWVNGELRAYPDAGWNDAKALDHSHALARPSSLRTQTTGGTAIDAEGSITPATPTRCGSWIATFVAESRMLFVDEMWIDEKGFLSMPAVQLNRVLVKGGPPPQLPFQVLKVQTGQKPVHR